MKKKLRRIWRQVTADKKKFGILVTFVAVGLLLWGRLILLEDVPRHATADPAENTQAVTTAAATPAAATATAPPPDMGALPEVRTELSDRLSLNLFAFRYDRYNPVPVPETPRIDIEDPQLSDDVEVRRRELQERLEVLHLQSVIQGGPRPLIVINGRLFRVGDSIDGFEIVSFNDRSATLTRDGLTFDLEMLTE